jgi:hypothetical protein
MLQYVPVRQRGIWKAEKELSRPRSVATVDRVKVLGAGRFPNQIGNGGPATSGESFKRRELDRLHENLHAFGFGHANSMHMHMHMSRRDKTAPCHS